MHVYTFFYYLYFSANPTISYKRVRALPLRHAKPASCVFLLLFLLASVILLQTKCRLHLYEFTYTHNLLLSLWLTGNGVRPSDLDSMLLCLATRGSFFSFLFAFIVCPCHFQSKAVPVNKSPCKSTDREIVRTQHHLCELLIEEAFYLFWKGFQFISQTVEMHFNCNRFNLIKLVHLQHNYLHTITRFHDSFILFS